MGKLLTADKNSLMEHPRVHGAIVGHLNLSTCQTFKDHLSTVDHFHQATLGSVYLEWSWSLGIGTDSCEAGKTQRNPYHFHLVATSILYHPISLPASNPIGITSDGVMSLLWPIEYPRRWSSEFNKPTTNITMELLEQPCWWHPNPENHLPSSYIFLFSFFMHSTYPGDQVLFGIPYLICLWKIGYRMI